MPDAAPGRITDASGWPGQMTDTAGHECPPPSLADALKESLMRRTNLPGHALRSEGLAYRQYSGGGWYQVGVSGSYRGHGLCECGESSPELDSNADRKRWHRDHKEEIRNGR